MDSYSRLDEFGRDWCEKNDALINHVSKLLPDVRSTWLDEFIMGSFADQSWDNENICSLFNLIRHLQVVLGIRSDDFSAFHQNKFRPLVQKLTDKSEEVLPGSFSDSAKHMKFKLDVFHEIERQFRVRLNDHGHPGDNGYGHDVSRLLSLTGMVPSNIGIRPISNREQRIDHGLTNELDPSLVGMAKDFLVLLFGLVQAKSVRIEGKSQSGLPARVFGKGYKTMAFINAAFNISDVASHADDLSYLLTKYDILHAFLQGSRRSPDAGGKRRYITTVADNALGLAGKTLQDNTIQLSKVSKAITKHFSTMRYRFVWGGNSVANSIVNVIGTSARECYALVYEFTFKHRGKEHLMSKLHRFCNIGEHRAVTTSDCDMFVLDVSNFDLDYPKALLQCYIDLFSESELGSFFARTAFSPSVQGTLDKDSLSDEPIVNGDPLNFNYEDYMDSGLPSGWSFVSDAGKMMALAIYYCLVKSKLLPEHSVAQLDAFLKGELDYGVWNLGDDNVILGPAGSFDAIKTSLEDFCAWKTEPEPGARFIGFPICVDDFGQYLITHDPASYVTNMLTPERGIRSSFRKYWAIGLQQREHVYADTALMSSFKKIINDKWKKHYGSNLDAVVESFAVKQRSALEEASKGDDLLIKHLYNRLGSSDNYALAASILSDVLRDHSVLAWKYSADDLKEAFGLDRALLESRPFVWTSEVILPKFGYVESEFSAVSNDDYNGKIFYLNSLDEDTITLLYNNFRSAKLCL